MIRTAARAIGFMVGWYTLLTIPFAFPPLLALALQGIVAIAFWQRYLDGGATTVPCRRRARYRLRPLGPARPAMIRIAALLALFDLALIVTYHTLLPPPQRPPTMLDEYVNTHPLGWVPLSFVVIVGAAFIEEFGFRGILQRSLERRLGGWRAIVITATIFAAAHIDAWHFGYLFLAGSVFGYTVYVTRSIWASVLLHGMHNAIALGIGALYPGDDAFERTVVGFAGFWIMPLVAAASGLLVVQQLRNLRDATRGGHAQTHTARSHDQLS